ncbi:HBR421Cp [Eremothecium sinecaudum]|uniref:HBR421Cp n=1 Tax=Eremothecium sinecaudum TaxID=45286 RepID=A0A120K1F3_9SACH|nr:HBR421Cp [Eremothecium sinecaudum]AMD19322.1 HBR421Cp [Eremothecium sinecaudum]
MEELYVYAGENMPRVKLTLLRRYENIEEVWRFLHRVQDRYSLQLGTIETITGNLKIRCATHENCEKCPYYILEFNEVDKNYSLWKLAGSEWQFGSIVASLYIKRQPSDACAKVPPEFLSAVAAQLDCGIDTTYVWDCLQRLCIPLGKVDWDEFASILQAMLKEKNVSVDDKTTLKGLVSVAALQAAIKTTKRQLEHDLLEYDARVKTPSTTDELTRNSSPESILPPSNSRSSSVSSLHYTYGLPATQLDTNFKAFFRSMAENFELFDEPNTVVRGRVSKPKKKAAAGRQGNNKIVEASS